MARRVLTVRERAAAYAARSYRPGSPRTVPQWMEAAYKQGWETAMQRSVSSLIHVEQSPLMVRYYLAKQEAQI